MMKKLIKKGRHAGPFSISDWLPRSKKASWTVVFTPSCRYVHPDSDQWDWNKLCGLSFSLIAMRHSAMVGWRYNPNSDEIELTAYVHDGPGVENRKMLPVQASVAIGEPIELSIQAKDNEYLFCFGSARVFVEKEKSTGWYARFITTWFGGQKKAPHDILIRIKANT